MSVSYKRHYKINIAYQVLCLNKNSSIALYSMWMIFEFWLKIVLKKIEFYVVTGIAKTCL